MVLLYPGCIARETATHVLASARQALTDRGIEFMELDDLACCGGPLRSAGLSEDFVQVAQANVSIIHKAGPTGIITLCPVCNRLLQKHYKRDAGLREELTVRHIAEVLAEQEHPVSPTGRTVCYHDSCWLGRRSRLFDEPRRALSNMGYEVVEPATTREAARCCGGGGLVRHHDRELAERIGQRRIDEIAATGADLCAVSCPHCLVNLSGKGVEVAHVAELAVCGKDAARPAPAMSTPMSREAEPGGD